MKITTNKTNNNNTKKRKEKKKNRKKEKERETTQVTQTVICHCANVAYISFYLVILLQKGTVLKALLYC